jgi:hypothetical protein
MANKNPKSASPISRTRSHQSLTVNKLESLLVEPPVITKGFSEIELVNTSTMDFLRILKKSTLARSTTQRSKVSIQDSRLKSTLKVANSKISPVHNSIRVRLIISLSQHWLPISYS